MKVESGKRRIKRNMNVLYPKHKTHVFVVHKKVDKWANKTVVKTFVVKTQFSLRKTVKHVREHGAFKF